MKSPFKFVISVPDLSSQIFMMSSLLGLTVRLPERFLLAKQTIVISSYKKISNNCNLSKICREIQLIGAEKLSLLLCFCDIIAPSVIRYLLLCLCFLKRKKEIEIESNRNKQWTRKQNDDCMKTLMNLWSCSQSFYFF